MSPCGLKQLNHYRLRKSNQGGKIGIIISLFLRFCSAKYNPNVNFTMTKKMGSKLNNSKKGPYSINRILRENFFMLLKIENLSERSHELGKLEHNNSLSHLEKKKE